ncbi:hypothetical protein HHK36_006711 [Tetracentron sinense]|uniref:NADH dehydrogenase subunit 11 n=1 Tax=Tetracentron sinense TaxID=13715 RepID=A0A834ZJH7_TETSI|nr:hypothetical protein HHK36_006711 [Tetracentron sinense]
MGLGLLALRASSTSALTRYSTLLSSRNPNNGFRGIVSTHPEAAAALAEPSPEIPPRTSVGGARIHFSNPDDAIEVFVDGFPVGECDLQDQSMAFGSDRGRFTEMKRSVVDKNLGPLVKTVMTRCIQCTRCVRFATEVAGVQDLGMLGRGSGEEIGTYVEKLMTKSIDVTDAAGSNIRIDSRGPEVMRILPRLNERLNDPMIRGPHGRFKAVSWRDALAVVAEVVHQVKPEEIVGIAGNGMHPQADLRSGYLMNTTIGCLEKADVFLLVGTQPRIEAPMVNARIRKAVHATQAKVGYIGPATELNYDYQHLGTGPQTLLEIAERRHSFCLALLNAKYPAIIVGAGLFERKDKDAIFSAVETIAKLGKVVRPDWNGLNVLLLNAAQAAALDLGLLTESGNSVESAKFLYLMGADDVNLEKLPGDAFVIYQGHHGDRSVYRANVILPASAFSEKEGT